MEKYCDHSIKEVCSGNREIVQKIYDHAMAFRESTPVEYRPLTVNSYINIVHNPGIDFADFFGEYTEGDYAFFACYMDGMYEKDMLINVKGSGICDVFFNGEPKKLTPHSDGSLDAEVTFQKGKNSMIVRVTAGKDGFSGYAKPILPSLRMFPAGYVYYTRQYIELDGYFKQNGISVSRLYRKHEAYPQIDETAIDWVFPIKPEQTNQKSFDFEKLCGPRGAAAYVYTNVQGRIVIKHESPLKVFCAGKAIYCADRGSFEQSFPESMPILIKNGRGAAGWGFSAMIEGETALPFVQGADCPDLQWIWIGPFGRDNDMISYPYAPEQNLQFEEPYPSVCAGSLYWRFYRPETYLKQNVHSAFFGQWFYAAMVGLYGLKQAAEKLGISAFGEYYMDGVSQMCRHRNYSVYDKGLTGWASYMPNSVGLNTLDPIGTIGMNVCEYYFMSGDVNAKYILQLLADRISNCVPRFEDGTFHRNTTMWTDDMYMCLPFLARLWAATGDKTYLDDIVVQVNGFYDRMFMEDQGLYSHIFFVKEGCRNCVPWCRGNGWVLLALSEVLLTMPKEYEGYQTVLRIFQTFAQGVLRHRDREKGIWHQVVNNPSSYIETSGSAMFIAALARGVKHGWLEADCSADVLQAWDALTERCIDAEGNVYGICMGSGCNMEESYYLNLETIVNDDHGVGVVLSAGVAVMDMLEE